MKKHGFFATVFVVLASLLFVYGCRPGAGPALPGEELVTVTADCGDSTGDVLNLNCPELPDPIFSSTPDYDIFAWNSFVAANWPALDPGSNHNQRGFPDTTKSFVGASSSAELVWETWKEKREIFVYPADTMVTTANGFTQQDSVDFNNWNSNVNYFNALEGVAMCDGSRVPDGARLIAGATKVNSLDEVEEVPSEALESPDQLCGQSSGYCANSANANEACCQVHGLSVEPLVWKGSPDTSDTGANLVRFEVKLNYDYWKYIFRTENQYYLQSKAESAATKAGIHLPYRISASSFNPGSGSGKDSSSVKDYAASTCLSDLGNVTTTSNETPCQVGSIQTKAAWVPLTSATDDYHTTTAYFYKADSSAPSGVCVESATYGLIGFHIIQRFHPPEDSDYPVAGAYLFATWEHNSVSSGYTYSNHLSQDTVVNGTTVPAGYYPPLNSPQGALPVERSTDRFGTDLSILSSTDSVNTQVYTALGCPGSVWCNYRLVGTQYAGVTATAADTTSNDVSSPSQTHYLANLVVETNYGLQKFMGTPPNKPFISHWGLLPTGPTFDRTAKNLAFQRTTFNMGGCMGCHGVVQQLGYSFSFVLQKNQNGTAPETPPPAR